MTWDTVELEPELLTVFVKTRMRETRESDRAQRAMLRCIAASHTADDDSEE